MYRSACIALLFLGATLRAQEGYDFGTPDQGHVLTLVHGTDDELVYRYLAALPGAARSNRGLPVILAVGSTLTDTARAFLDKYRPETIRRIGPPHPELPQAEAATDQWPCGGTVVVCARTLRAAVQAACLAVRLDAPLLIESAQLGDRLRSLGPERILVLGGVTLPAVFAKIEQIEDPTDVARVAGGADYIAVCNVADEGSQTAALAAVLAAVRGGVVLPLDLPIARHRIPLQVSKECPPGLEDVDGTGSYLTTQFQAGGHRIIAAAVQTTSVRVASQDSPRYGRLRIDLDGDGVLEKDEEPRVGSSIELDGRPFHLTYHYRHPFVGYLPSEIILDEINPAEVREAIQDLAADLGSAEFLAIVGTPGVIPFCYSEATGYFEAFDIKQELPSDAPYANLDEDSALELAVGRLPVEDLETGSALIATTVSYPRLQGDWSNHATMIQPGFHKMEGSLPWVLPNAEALIRGIEGDLAASGIGASRFYRDAVDVDDVLHAMSRSGWIAYFNHSGPGTWGIHPGCSIVSTQARGKNDRSLPPLAGAPIVFGGGCSSAALDVGQPLDTTFPGRFFELGAVAYLGNTRVAYARSEHLVQPFFARLASGERTLGQAYRDGRNLLAHLLEGGHLIDTLEYGIDVGNQDFLWGQHQILNLFGDPALLPMLPPGARPPIDIELAETDEPGLLRLVITNHGEDRCDPVQMMAASGQGAPREFFARTGPGMTSSNLPHHFVDQGLSPVRSTLEIQPGAWVDLELPTFEVDVELRSGPGWADRGFAVLPGARDEPRLQMFVPLVRASLELGEGEVATRIEFDVTQGDGGRSSSGIRPRVRPRIHVEAPWAPQRTAKPVTSDAAEEILARVRNRHQTSTPQIPWTMSNPQARLYGEEAHFRGTWDDQGRASLHARRLPTHLQPRVDEVEQAAREVAELPFRSPLPALEGMRVEATSTNDLVLTPLEDGQGDERTEVRVSDDGTIERVIRRQFGVAEETRFQWSNTDRGPVLLERSRHDPVRPEDRFFHKITYGSRGGQVRPQRITLHMQGRLPRDYHFDFKYQDVY